MCFLFIQQAAEKALKAAQYLVHFSRDNYHDLCTLACTLDTNIRDLALKLEVLLGSNAHMRYPDLWPAPTVPHDHFDSKKAEDAVALASEIVNIVEEKVSSRTPC